ncbi:MAG: oxidoreductase [Candidatus Scalindua rubra]|uniref:Oxidoreductase n=1 Tax=Candidatus Scalindua rubra TaxID=1872076 RepID=A0A1E3XFY9_9BACT|nr:MAG: oxidoreductase [Candidatus Scalindua rubra]
MRVLFVYPNVTRAKTPQIGIASLSAVLKQAGHQVDLFDFTFIENAQIYTSFKSRIKEFCPDLIAVSCRSLEFPYVKQLLSSLDRKDKSVFVVIGGVHATVAPDEVIAFDSVDSIIRGEGEYPLLELVNNLENGHAINNIQNLWLKRNGRVIKNEIRPLLDNLDVLPYPDFERFDDRHFFYESHFNRKFTMKRVGAFETSRGCPYSCSYCVNAYLQELTRGKSRYHREKSVQRVIEELAFFTEKLQLEYVYLIDETFLLKMTRLKEFIEAYMQRVRLPFSFMTHPQTVTDKKIELVAKAGADLALIGIECGDEEFRKNVLRRPVKDKDIKRAFQIVKKYGISTYSFNLIGFPGENRKLIGKTIKFNREVKPDVVQVTMFYPFPGTELLKTCIEQDLIDSNVKVISYYEDTILKLPRFGKGQLLRIYRLFHYYVNASFFTLPFLLIMERVPFLFDMFFLTQRYLERYLDEIKYLPYLLRKYGLLGLVKKIIKRSPGGKYLTG